MQVCEHAPVARADAPVDVAALLDGARGVVVGRLDVVAWLDGLVGDARSAAVPVVA